MHRNDEVQGFEGAYLPLEDPSARWCRRLTVTVLGLATEGGKSQGKLSWSYSYWPKLPLNPELQASPDLSTITPSKTLTEMEMRPGDIGPSPAAKDGPPPPATPLRTPPDPAYPSGILSVIVHGLSKLEKAHLEGSGGSEGDTGQDTDDLGEIDLCAFSRSAPLLGFRAAETDAFASARPSRPSPYAEILYNDQLLYQTRCVLPPGHRLL
jgi:hypothetical protein